MAELDSTSVYNLLTQLCEKLVCDTKANTSDAVKRLRRKSYEILLSKKVPDNVSNMCLQDCKDPHCELLAWEYLLIHKYKMPDQANELHKGVECFKKSTTFNSEISNNILVFLLQLKTVPPVSSTNMKSRFEDSYTSLFKIYSDEHFRLPEIFNSPSGNFKKFSFHLPKNGHRDTFIHDLVPSQDETSEEYNYSKTSEEDNCWKQEEYKPIQIGPQLNVWEIALNTEYTDLRTWETLRNPTPPKELPFLTESSSMQYYNYIMQSLDPFGVEAPTRYISYDDFIADVKNLLVGIVAHIFLRNESGEISLAPGISVRGLSHTALKSYCKQMIFAEHCYRALLEMASQKKQPGYIFAALYGSIRKYLNLYRVAALSLPSSEGIPMLHDHISKLSSQLRVLCSICKVGPFADTNTTMQHSVTLLNSLNQYEKAVLNTSDIMIINSVLYKCLQVYFSMFLRQWILEGVTADPHNEFFIRTVDKYLAPRGRTYWTQSYTVHEDFVPDFLSSFKLRILNCGKTMNLLKLCVPNSPTCQYLMGKKPNIFRCCFTNEQLEALECESRSYYLEVISSGGPMFTMRKFVERNKEQSRLLLNLIASKRAVTLKKIEAEKLLKLQEISRKRTAEMLEVKRQYDLAMEQKEDARLKDFEKERRNNEEQIKIQKMEEKIIQEEANNMIEYYNNLFEKSDKCQESIKKHIDAWKNVSLDGNKSDTSSEVSTEIIEPPTVKIHTSQSLDLINANTVDECGDIPKTIERNSGMEPETVGTEIILRSHQTDTQKHIEKTYCAPVLTDAQKNKLRVMGTEFGITMNHDKMKYSPQTDLSMSDSQKTKLKVMGDTAGIESKYIENNRPLTDAQRNKLRVMSTEYNINITGNTPLPKDEPLTTWEINRNHNMGTNPHLYRNTNESGSNQSITCDNEIDINKNKPAENKVVECDVVNENYLITPGSNKKASHLKLDLNRVTTNSTNKLSLSNTSSVFSNFFKSPNFEFHKPMSVDSTPLTDFSPLSKLTDRYLMDTDLSTAASNFTDEGFAFNVIKKEPVLYISTPTSTDMTTEEAKSTSVSCLKYYIQKSIEVPLIVQTNLVQNELLKHFMEDLKYLEHLASLRNYFFLLDGEFGRNITEELFERLYDVDMPEDLINFRSLKHLVYNAVEFSSKYNENSKCLSFKINVVPNRFDLGDIEVLDCLSLSYKVSWPMSILLPSDTIAKYDDVFKFLLKLHRVSWVAKKIFMELKLLPKTLEENGEYLLLSPQYQNMQQYRHIMTHFVQTLQNYVVGEVLQSSWSNFEENLVNVTNIDDLYALHTMYIKNILFMCWLNHRSARIKQVLNNIFTVILKFYNNLRSMDWEFDDCAFVHPNYNKLEKIFNNFLECVQYLFRAGHKVARVGYQPQLVQLLDMLDLNEFYTRRNMRQHT